jgi:hypothetical protein
MGISRTQVVAVLLVGLLVCSFVPVVPAGTATGSSASSAVAAVNAYGGGGAGFVDLAAEDFEADRTRFEITVRENGSATWIFQHEQRLESDEAIASFERYAERFNTNETETYRNFRNRATSLTVSGSEVTGRNMTANSFAREARVDERSPAGDEFAVIEMSFTWTNFARADGDRLVVGDVFVDGLYVGPDQELRFERGPSFRFESVDPAPDSIAAGTLAESESVTWLGETQFTDRRPRLIYTARNTPAAQTPTLTDSPDGTDSPKAPTASPTETPADSGSIMPVVAILVALLVGAGAAIARRSGWLSDSVGTIDSSGDASSGGSDGATDSPDSAPVTSDATGPTREGESATAAQTAVSDEDLLSDEERVVTLLEANGGRMKQVDIVDGTNWSKSKVSMLLSDMEDEGTISRLRVGRENIVSLSGHEPDAAGSPFDDGK